ncbi:cobalt-zinc-cadmium efflux system outer membrane protein [Nitrospirillum amazonense]|uniref:Cobalt-zinc-cadmium efflux system outer membrane protein n=1 Tax=Nitrospirillum amazonense TaxID=28077 RepID=A0A560JAP6_9PROT|nr:TolC family protein [Nitrospirillum amazonense]TWB67579.1 cobalt-zinc-cadmium efflux system outer membrane protein [Nitrospirillum amazonense]
MRTAPCQRLLTAALVAAAPTWILVGTAPFAPALAAPAPSYAQLLGEAEVTAPRLLAAKALIAQAEGLADQAGTLPNPTVSVLTENVAGTRNYRAFDQAETTLQFNQLVELGGKRGARQAAGQADVDASQAHFAATRIAYACDLALAYADAEAADRRVDLAEDELEEAQRDDQAARALVAAGREATVRTIQSQATLTSMRADLSQAKAARAAALDRLAVLAGAPEPYTAFPVSLLDTAVARTGGDGRQDPPTGDPLASPGYRASVADREAAFRRLEVERARATPDVTASLGVRRLEGDRATTFVAGVSIPLPLFDRNRGNISAAQASLTGAEARLEAARREAEAGVRSARLQARAAQDRLAAADQSLAAAQEAYRLTRIAYEGGKAPLSELLTARHALGVANATKVDAQLARVDAITALARVQGRIPFGD